MVYHVRSNKESLEAPLSLAVKEFEQRCGRTLSEATDNNSKPPFAAPTETSASSKYPPRTSVEPILFLSRTLSGAETRYWPTELETAGCVWVIRKIQHLIESSLKPPAIIFTDHSAIPGLAKQSDITTTVSVERLNLRLVRASEYLSRFQLDICYKPGRAHLVPDALSHLPSSNGLQSNESALGELDTLYGTPTMLLQISKEFKAQIMAGYVTD